jgi:hypothetical protein
VTVPHDQEMAGPAESGASGAPGGGDDAAARLEMEPMETNDVLIVGIGTALFAVAFVVLYPMHASLERSGHGRWPWVALSGVLLGLVGLFYCLRRAQRMSKVNAQ